jgi:hypothetical protein
MTHKRTDTSEDLSGAVGLSRVFLAFGACMIKQSEI